MPQSLSAAPAGILTYAIENVTRGLTIASRVGLAQTSAARRRGLLDVTDLDAESGLWIYPCEAIHTFGMKVPLDALFLDADLQIRKIAPNLRPWRIAGCIAAESVLELRAGTVERTGTQLRDRLQFHRLQSAQPVGG